LAPKNFGWKGLAEELAIDKLKLKKKTNDFVYKKGTKQYDGMSAMFTYFMFGLFTGKTNYLNLF
jgi:hypothetical protein